MLEKVTIKTTKEELKEYLRENSSKVKDLDKNLYERLAYTSAMMQKDPKKVTRSDLAGLVKEVMSVLATPVVAETPKEEPKETPKKSSRKTKKTEETPAETHWITPVAENSTKKVGAGVSKKQEFPNKGAEPKKSNSGANKTAPKKDGVTVLNPVNTEKAVQLAKVFPQSLTVGDTTYEQATDIKTMDDLYESLNNDEEIIFAFYWTKRHLKQFPYFSGWLGQPKSFDNDLDLASTIYVSDEKKVSYQVSMYTDAMYAILPDDLENIDGVRYSEGIEYQIYRAVTE